MSQLNKWMTGGKISKLVVVITSKETGENVERWQFDVKLPTFSSRFFAANFLSRTITPDAPYLGPNFQQIQFETWVLWNKTL